MSRRVLVLIVAALAAAGCGRERLAVPDVEEPLISRGTQPLALPRAGLDVDVPEGWSVARGTAPLVVQTTSGSAAIAIWRYPRTEPLPEDDAQFDAAKAALLQAVKQRDETYKEVSTRRVEVDGEPALELVGDERIAGRERRVRSTHVFAHDAELVVDQYAPPKEFARLDTAVFRPFVQALEIAAPR